MMRLLAIATLGLGLSGCLFVGGDVWYDLGPPDLTVRLDLATDDAGAPPDLIALPDLVGYTVAPDPYVRGVPRLTIGDFYEGGSSEQVPLDNTTSHLYIYPSGNTLVIADDQQDKLEGYVSSDLTVAGGLGWFGFGIHWDAPHDLSAYKALHLALKSSAGSMTDVVVGLNSPMNSSPTSKLSARKYGYANDGAWHRLIIPMADFAAASPNPVNPKQVGTGIVILNGGVVANGDVVKLDDLYFE